jgi:4-hydroxybenzoate polyprenyltransferase
MAFAAFCAASSAVYVFNDILDRHYDQLHPWKRSRPLASGQVQVREAAMLAIGLAGLGILTGMLVRWQVAILIVAYIVLMVLYTLVLRRVMILDCMVISLGVCLRAAAGAVAVGVAISPWLMICTFALSLFVAFGKRRAEVTQLGDGGSAYRQVLADYSPELLGHMLDVTSGLAIICFLLYAMDQRTAGLFGTNALVYTVPLVLFCVFRFSAAMQSGRYPDPVGFILRDRPFQIAGLAWVAACAVVVYGGYAIKGWFR